MRMDREGYAGRSGEPATYEDYMLCDPLGNKIGKVERFLVDGDGEPACVRVRIGLFGRTSVLLPVTRITVDEKKRTILLR